MEFPVSIRQFLPHRSPMLMVDDVLFLDEYTIETDFKIKEDNIFIEDGCLNEVGIIENAAQTCSGIIGWPQFEANKSNKDYKVLGYISKIKNVEIHQLPPVNSILNTKGELISKHIVGDIYNCDLKCFTYYNQQKIADCFLNLIITV